MWFIFRKNEQTLFWARPIVWYIFGKIYFSQYIFWLFLACLCLENLTASFFLTRNVLNRIEPINQVSSCWKLAKDVWCPTTIFGAKHWSKSYPFICDRPKIATYSKIMTLPLIRPSVFHSELYIRHFILYQPSHFVKCLKKHWIRIYLHFWLFLLQKRLVDFLSSNSRKCILV